MDGWIVRHKTANRGRPIPASMPTSNPDRSRSPLAGRGSRIPEEISLHRCRLSRVLFPLRLHVALRGEIYRDADSVSVSLATQRNAQP